MRLQHNISPPAPGRGGSRKRKRGATDDHTQGTSTPVASAVASLNPAVPNVTGFVTFKVESHTPSEAVDDPNEYIATVPKSKANGKQRRQLRGSQLQNRHSPSPEDEEEDGYASPSSEFLPPSLQAHFDENTGLVLGRTPAKVMYLVMKAKHRYVLDQHEQLKEQMRIMKDAVDAERNIKERTLDDLFHQMLGYAATYFPLMLLF